MRDKPRYCRIRESRRGLGVLALPLHPVLASTALVLDRPGGSFLFRCRNRVVGWSVCVPLIAALVLQQKIVGAQTRPDPATNAAPPKPGSGGSGSDLDTSAAFERARSFYQIGSYDQCAEAYASLLPEVMPAASRGQPVEQARVTYA